MLAAASGEVYDMKFGLLFNSDETTNFRSRMGSGLHLPGGAIR